MMTDDGLPNTWTSDRDRLEFVKWLDALMRLVEGGPTDWYFWYQTRDVQEILGRLARRLGYPNGPIERRSENVILTSGEGREAHERLYVVATDPLGVSRAEWFEDWINYLDSKPHRFCLVRGGTPQAEFRRQALACFRLWREAMGLLGGGQAVG